MLDVTTFDRLFASITLPGAASDAAGARKALDAIRAAFDASQNPFERHGVISAQISAAGPGEVRQMLIQLRATFETRVFSAAVGAVYQAFSRCPEEGWSEWLARLGETLGEFHNRMGMQLCEAQFPFDPSHQQAQVAIRHAVQCMCQSRWEEAYEGLELLSSQQSVPQRSRARLIMLVGQVELWKFTWREAARRRFEEADALAPDDPQIAGSLGDFWLYEKNTDRAVEYYQRAIELAPSEASGYIGMGDRFQKDESLDEHEGVEKAEWWFREAVAKGGDDTSAHDRLLSILGRPESLKSRESEFLALVDTKLAVDPDGRYDTYRDVGQYYANCKDFSTARTWYEKAIALEARWPLAYTSLAELCRTQGNAEEAEALCIRSIEAAPECPTAYLVLTELYEEQDRWADALKLYEEFPPLPRHWTRFARAGAGKMKARLGHVEEAEKILIEELRAYPEERYALNALQELAEQHYQERHDKDAALKLYDEIFRIRGESYKGTYHNLLGNLHYDLDDYRAAADEWRQAVAASPDEPVFYRNLGNACQLLGEFDEAERAAESAYQIDKDEKALRERKALLANAAGNAAYERSAYGEAAGHYRRATELDPTEVVYLTNLAVAWERTKDPVSKTYALEQAVQCYERAQEVKGTQEYAERIGRLRRRITFLQKYGEQVLQYTNVIMRIAVEVAGDLAFLLEGSQPERLSDELLASVEPMRGRISTDLGLALPRLLFRPDSGYLSAGTYVIMINEIPLVSGTLRPGLQFCPAAEEVLSGLGVWGERAYNPSGPDGSWIAPEHWEKVQSGQLELWPIAEYLLRHIEAVVRANAAEFAGHQEIVNLLDSGSTPLLQEIRASSQMTSDLTTVCKALLEEGVPIYPFDELCSAFKDLRTRGSGLREIVESIRQLSSFRNRLQGNGHGASFLTLSPRFEAEVRQSLYQADGRLTLAMEPQRCQDALAAVRQRAAGGSQAIVVEDPVLRPFVRKLVELEFPKLAVLSHAELRTGTDLAGAGVIDLEDGPALNTQDFRSPTRLRGAEPEPAPASSAGAVATSPMTVEAFVGEEFDKQPPLADAEPMGEILSLIQGVPFYELGTVLPEVQLRTDPNLKGGDFRIRLNGVDQPAVPELAPDEFVVNETLDRLALLGIQGRKAAHPSTGVECTIVRETKGQVESCKQAGLTTFGRRGLLMWSAVAAIRRAAAKFESDEVVQYQLDSLAEAFPDLVRLAVERYTVPGIARVLRELIGEEISIRDLRSVLESLLALNGTTDVDLSRFIVFLAYTDALCPNPAARNVSELTTMQLADFVRASLKRYISSKYSRAANTLTVYLVDPSLEGRLAELGKTPLTDAERERLRAAIHDEVDNLPPTAANPVVLTTFEVRRALRKAIEQDFPRLPVVSYQELSPDLNIQPIARISWWAPAAP